ncbi:uncharacterized protein ACA1_397210 [Acanthamoeba castellanii str. Neff]|uniref:Uncharacterized protein n=1 Tax=Acanthamoeba castellanii (strain ATCC 30010 / Neff) TaxID=1257118 RepID=L8HCF1_ACACF|nr:uncharacterized protein ACA1_397210 [Acanthamoeba castellanii str. Neff]ELR22875.1 hypothetical protein ACA1_397210 [Acanthamoeba castellanii str. Neff]
MESLRKVPYPTTPPCNRVERDQALRPAHLHVPAFRRQRAPYPWLEQASSRRDRCVFAETEARRSDAPSI